ncbi:hypothetical protein C5E06_15440 [Pseudoclavibacter sp. RFBI5]|uniref:sugar phosphate isomerase/epimerase family protein n=1 Tax=Pseudoclavibacter sp. RFBI5 TaxID=2080578 RepID=UPI000CE894EA|nr:sugar phosphate isomerase/epimerase [Pseudoclavibacter sp. RFBI5]PPG01776.1 hypothetical protein C5E06_15440 [Pseudoclavibacter sp. RFBI5]
MKLCCSSPMVPGATLTEKAERLSAWGYDTIAIFQPFADWNDDIRSELGELESQTGVRPVEFVLTDDVYGNAMSPDADLRDRCRGMYLEAASVCAELGLVTEIEFEYGAQNPLPLFDPFLQLDSRQQEGFLNFYAQMLDVVDGTAGRVLLEPLNRYESRYLNRASDNVHLLEMIDHPSAGLLPDTFHMSIEEADIAATLRQCGGHVKQVHLGENNRLLPGHGSLDWPSIIGALRDIGYTGSLNLECSTHGDPERSLPETARFLRALIDA